MPLRLQLLSTTEVHKVHGYTVKFQLLKTDTIETVSKVLSLTGNADNDVSVIYLFLIRQLEQRSVQCGF